MAQIVVKGNVGQIKCEEHNGKTLFEISVAESFGYFDKEKNEWVSKGTKWHQCVAWFDDANHPKLETYKRLIKKGTPVVVIGNTNINPSKAEDGKEYLNEYIRISDIALSMGRIDTVTYKEAKQSNVATDPEFNQTPSAPTPNDEEKCPF